MSSLEPMCFINFSPTSVIIELTPAHLSIQKNMRLSSPIRQDSRGSIRWHRESRLHQTQEHFIGTLAFHNPCPLSRYICTQSTQRLPVPSVRIYHKCFRAAALLHSENFLIPNPHSFLGCVTCVHATWAFCLSIAGLAHRNFAIVCSTLLYTFNGSTDKED